MTRTAILITINGIQYPIIKLDGDGQCSCYCCEQKHGWNRQWTCMCYEHEGHVYCYECLKELLERKQN